MFWSLAFCILLQTCIPPPAPIRVVGVGDSAEQARDAAYREAMETYMGSVVVSDKEMRDYQLVKDSVMVYSSAYVDKMRVISETKQGNKFRIEMDIWISSSKIANRILTIYPKDQNIDSARISEQFRTYASSKQKGDKLLENVLEIFPSNAFYISNLPIEFKIDTSRVPYLRIPYTVNWNKNYFIALEETVKVISDGKAAKNNPAASVVFGSGSSWFLQPYFFNDIVAVRMMYSKFEDKKPAVRLNVVNGNSVVYTTCQKLNTSFHSSGYGTIDLLGNKVYQGEFNIRLPANLPANVKTQLSIETENNCAV